ncbi:hypothetical protein QAD02_003387, partial [Eretmocerus hayati]
GQSSEALLDDSEQIRHEKKMYCLSQPELPPIGVDNLLSTNKAHKMMNFFSQPTSIEDLLVSSQLQAQCTQASQTTFQRLVRRMTRFSTATDRDSTLEIIKQYLINEQYNIRANDYGQ